MVADALRFDYKPGSEAEQAATRQALDHLPEPLQIGAYVAIQDHQGHTFIGTPDETTERMIGS